MRSIAARPGPRPDQSGDWRTPPVRARGPGGANHAGGLAPPLQGMTIVATW